MCGIGLAARAVPGHKVWGVSVDGITAASGAILTDESVSFTVGDVTEPPPEPPLPGSVLDTFGGTNGNPITSRQTDSGHDWIALTNNFLLQDGEASVAGNPCECVIETVSPDGTLRAPVRLTPGGTSLQGIGLIGRATDVGNLFLLWAAPVNNALKLYRKQDGGNFQEIASQPMTFVSGTEYVLELVMSGQQLTGRVVGGIEVLAVESFNQAAVRHGIRGQQNNGDATVSQFEFIPAE